MRLLLISALAVSLTGCSIIKERAPDYAVNALDQTAYRATNVALDGAESSVRNAGSSSSSDDRADESQKVTRKLDNDDVLVKQGDDYLVGKRVGDMVLLVASGKKISPEGVEVINVRRAKKSDLKIGNDVFFTSSRGDVRRGTWSFGAVTDDAQLGDGFVAAGSETELLWDGQVAVRR